MSAQGCLECGSPAASLCGGCRAVAYCGAKCQRSGWQQHKNTCASLPSALRTIKLRPPVKTVEVESPLCLGATRKAVTDYDSYYLHRDVSNLQQRLTLIGKKGVVVADDTMFAQLVIAAVRAKNTLVIGLGGWAPWILMDDALKDVELGVYRPGYFAPKNVEAYDLVHQTTGLGGIWLLGPDQAGRYLGMASEGPKRQLLSTWHELLTQRLDKAVSVLSPDIRQTIRLLLVDDLGLSGYEVHRAHIGAE